MDIVTLCNKIELQAEMKDKVFAFTKEFDYNSVNHLLAEFCFYEKMNDSRVKLQSILGEDADGIKILSCMLKASADIYDVYKAKGIRDDIYFDTMKCYTRFIKETHMISGQWCFDRYWWTVRQAGGHLFRIGELEYEIKLLENKKVIGLHIPSFSDFSKEAVDRSFEEAKLFFEKYFPEVSECEWICRSWLLDNQLQNMLSSNSNIVQFQKRFEILDEGEMDIECINWIFQCQITDYEKLPEKTSLQRNVKKHLLEGGVIRNSFGRIK